jgi:hypothetical protein
MEAFARAFEEPDDTTRFANGSEHVVNVRGTPVGLTTFQPGWRWSNDVRPLMGTDSCSRTSTHISNGREHAHPTRASAC